MGNKCSKCNLNICEENLELIFSKDEQSEIMREDLDTTHMSNDNFITNATNGHFHYKQKSDENHDKKFLTRQEQDSFESALSDEDTHTDFIGLSRSRRECMDKSNSDKFVKQIEFVFSYWQSEVPKIKKNNNKFVDEKNGKEQSQVLNSKVESHPNARQTGLVNEDGKMHGQGKLTWFDKSQQEGEWLNDKANGIGKLEHVEGDYYFGEWYDDKAHGFGKYMHKICQDKQLEYQIGFWRKDKQHGIGTERRVDGTQQQGKFKRGRKCGRGTMVWQDGNQQDGQFSDNMMEGTGIQKWRDERCQNGGWVQNRMEGQGLFLWPDGRRQEGQYKNNRKHGFGKFTKPDPDGFEQIGQWRDGLKHDEGQLTKDGQTIAGIWENGEIKEEFKNEF